MQRIQGKIDAASGSMARLQGCLSSLSGTGNPSRTKQVWRSVISITKEKEIVKQMERISRLDKEVMAELQIAGLMANFEAKDDLSRIYSRVQHDHNATAHRLVDMQSNLIQTHALAKQIEGTANSLQPKLHLESRTIQQAIYESHQKTTKELALVRDDILRAITSTGNEVASEQHFFSSRISQSESQRLAQQVLWQLARCPTSLKSACEYFECLESSSDQNLLVNRRSTRTRPRSRQKHQKYTFSLKLPFLVRKTVDLTFCAGSGAGGVSFGQYLTCFNTVQRVASPAFRLFDNLQASVQMSVDVSPRTMVFILSLATGTSM